MKITGQEQEIRKERIIETAFRLFCQRGIEQIPLSGIAKAAGVGETTVYRYFTNKAQLVVKTLSVLWRSIGEQLEAKVEETAGYEMLTGLEQFALHLESYKQLYMKNSDYVLFSYESKLYLLRNGVQLTRQQYDYLMESIKGPCIMALEKGKADGSILSSESSEDLFYAIWGAVRGYIVKIVIYRSLCEGGGPWESRYPILQDGIISALRYGKFLLSEHFDL